MKKIVFILVAIAFTGCSTLGINMGGGSKKNAGPELTAINCSGFAGWEKCNAQAARMCPKGYDVANREEDMVAQRRTMYITCNQH